MAAACRNHFSIFRTGSFHAKERRMNADYSVLHFIHSFQPMGNSMFTTALPFNPPDRKDGVILTTFQSLQLQQGLTSPMAPQKKSSSPWIILNRITTPG